MIPRRKRATGFTAVELCLLISGLGILLAMAIPTFAETLRTSKTAEAGEHLGRLMAGASAYYADFHEITSAAGIPHRETHCLPESAGPLPAIPSAHPTPARFTAETTPGSATFRALGFSPPHPVRYSYVFVASESGCQLQDRPQPVSVRCFAQGDLDGDGVLSQFERRATAGPEGLEVDPVLWTEGRVE